MQRFLRMLQENLPLCAVSYDHEIPRELSPAQPLTTRGRPSQRYLCAQPESVIRAPDTSRKIRQIVHNNAQSSPAPHAEKSPRTSSFLTPYEPLASFVQFSGTLEPITHNPPPITHNPPPALI